MAEYLASANDVMVLVIGEMPILHLLTGMKV
jgi:hypothetical protein